MMQYFTSDSDELISHPEYWKFARDWRTGVPFSPERIARIKAAWRAGEIEVIRNAITS